MDKSPPGQVLARVSGLWVTHAHTFFIGCAFVGSLVVGCWLHYFKIVQNEHFGYPDEWFPSVSATIGDRYPERSIFQLFIALTAGPRFALVLLTYLLTAQPHTVVPKVLATCGVLRTLTCGGWTYVTSTDDHDWHDIFMISYIVLTLPWTVLRVQTTPRATRARQARVWCAAAFFGTLVPLVYFFIQHKVHRIPGAYTTYAFFEWALIVLDVAFDACTAFDFGALEIRVVDMAGVTAAAQYNPRRADRESRRKHYGFGALSFAVEISNAFVFWSVLTALPLVIWYFPLWYMGISGWEAMLASILAPFVLYVAPIRLGLIFIPQLALLGTSVGVAAAWAQAPTTRLQLTGVGAAFGCLHLAISFWGIDARPSAGLYRGTAFSLGLMVSSVAKMAFYTNNPIWPIMHDANGGWNRTGLVLALVGAFLSTRLQYSPTQPLVSAGKRESAVAAGLGLGGLLFGLHSLLADSSTLALWTWTGYPVRGPLPIPHGLLTLAAMGLGVYLGVHRPTLSGTWLPYALANIGALVLYSCPHWTGFAGGLVLATHLVSIVPTFLQDTGRHHPATAFGTAFLTLMLLYLAHVWVVAYAFVPGGPLLRERTDLVLLAQQLCIGAGIWAHSRVQASAKNTVAHTNSLALGRRIRSQVSVALAVILMVAAAVDFKRFHRDAPRPHHPEAQLMTTGIWTIHFGLDNDMWASEGRMRDVIGELELDVVGLLESDTQRVIMGQRDLTQQIAEELGYYADFGPGPNKHTWGAALLSKFPIVKSTHHLLPSPVGELAPAIHATLDVYGHAVDIVVFHSGQEEDPEDRRLQSLYLADLMASSTNPLVLLSYLVTKPLEGNYHTYVGELSTMKDIDASDWDRWCEYILYKGIKRTGYARVSRSTITDTEIQVGKFVVGGVDGAESSDTRIDEADVPESLRFPPQFKGEGVRGHRYHVFDEPRYFA